MSSERYIGLDVHTSNDLGHGYGFPGQSCHNEDVYIRAFDCLVTRPVAAYRYSANWIICTGETFTR